MKNILWLVSWYPNKLDRFDGDFIQRHARAVALFCKVHVIYIKKDTGLAAGKVLAETLQTGNLSEHVIFYNPVRTGIKFIDRILSHRKYIKLYKKAILENIALIGKPDNVHVHVAMKAGMLALWIKRKWGIPFVVSEHWTGYLSNADSRVAGYPFIFQKKLKKILTEASQITVVSHHLGKAIQKYFPALQYQVIPNVVDTDIFYPVQKQLADKVRFIHISNMNYQKNTEDILEALHLLKEKDSFEMFLYGSSNTALMQMIDRLVLENNVFVMGEVQQPELAKAIQQSDALVLYSRYETFGCVLIEANACGIPVIVSDIEVFHELIEAGKQGIFAETENSAVLAGKLKQFILQKNNFDGKWIAQTTAAKYNFSVVGQMFSGLYNR